MLFEIYVIKQILILWLCDPPRKFVIVEGDILITESDEWDLLHICNG